VKRGESNEEGYVLNEQDKERLGRGYSLISDKTDAREAFLLISAAFWSNAEVQEDGRSKTTYLPPCQRPTFAQFMRWGPKRNTKDVIRRRVGADRWGKSNTHRGGSTLSQTIAFGHIGVFDSTSTDLHLVSMWDREKKLSPATRTLLIELRSTAILGFYCGF
jgi:hypothetical protein